MPSDKYHRPKVVAKIAQTLDGKTATSNGKSKWITSQKARDYARRQRDEFDAILVGARTALRDNPRLTGVKNKSLIRIVVDSTLTLPFSSNVLKRAQTEHVVVATTRRSSERRRNRLTAMGVSVILCPQKNRRVDLKYMMNALYEMGVRRLLIEGGATITGSALRWNLIDQMHIYMAPKVMGDQTALSSVQGNRVLSMDRLTNLDIKSVRTLGGDILVLANVYRNR